VSQARRDSTQARYRFVRELGRGGMGAVELVFDAVRGQEIARKRILNASASELLRHKHEFPAIAPLRQPNRVALYELDADGDGHFFTMEAVHGARIDAYCSRAPVDSFAQTQPLPGQDPTGIATSGDAFSHVRRAAETRTATSLGAVVPVASDAPPRAEARRASTCDFERLLGALRQILDALAFLHGEGIVHCDIKPSNVMVRGDGVVKLLDFGILSRMSASPDARRSTGIAGTAAYMAPELIRGTWPTPAVDLYALGVMVFEIASGRLPFAAESVADVLRRHLFEPTPLLSSVATGVPESLTQACRALMAKQAESRPTIDALARMLFAVPLRVTPRRPSGPAELVGREAITAALRRRVDFAREGNFTTAILAGPSGSGKTSLFDWLASHCARDRVVVLRGAARPAERIAFNGIDGAIDDLARLESNDPEVARLLEAASAAFPVLHEGPASRATTDRARAFTATIDAMARAARSHGLVLAIDDVQWADSDSLAFLDAMVDAEPPRVLLVVAVRDDLGEGAASQWVQRRLGADAIYVGPLSRDATEEILGRAARADSAPPSVNRLVEACAGSPFLAELMGRALARGELDAAGSIVGLLARIIARTTPLGGRLVSAVVASGDSCLARELAEVVERPFGDVEDAMAVLEADGLVRRLGGDGPTGRWDVRHDAVRAAVIEASGAAAVARAHAAFAVLLAPRGDDEVCRRVRHLVASGQEAEGAMLARRAAVVAERQLAFGLAAEMYAIALRAPGADTAALQQARALALERIGAYRDAASCWHEVRAGAGGRDEIAAALMREARALLAANDIAPGYARLAEALAARGERMPGGGAGAALSMASFLAGPMRAAPRFMRAMEPAERSRVEADIHTALLVAHFDVLSGLRLLQRAQRRFSASGAAEGAAWCDYTFAFMAYVASARRGPVPLAERYRTRAAQRLGARAPEILEVATFPRLLDAIVALRDGDPERARTTADAGLAILEESGMRGSHTHLFGLSVRVGIERSRQNVFSYEQQLRRMRLAAREGTDAATDCVMRVAEAHIQHQRGDFAGALLTLRALDASWPADIKLSQRGAVGVEATFVRLALGDVRGAREERDRLLRVYSSAALLGNMYVGYTASQWALCEVLALKLGERGASARKARSYVTLAERAPPVLATGAVRAAAYLEEHLGHPDAALTLLARADDEATRAGQPVDAAIARYQRGRRLGGEEGAALVAAARALLVESGASERLLEEDGG
jgi:serine/threonine protein kinase